MNHRPNYKFKSYKTTRKKKIRENLSDLEFVNNFLETTTEAGSMKEKKKK